MNKLFCTLMLLNVVTIPLRSHDDSNKNFNRDIFLQTLGQTTGEAGRFVLCAIRSVIPCATPAWLIGEAYLENDPEKLSDIKNRFEPTIAKSGFSVLLFLASIMATPKAPKTLSIFFAGHACGLLVARFGESFAENKKNYLKK